MSKYRAKYMIEMGENGPRRPADEAEDLGIDAHRADNRTCNGTQIRDDHYNTWPTGRRRLWCVDCEAYVDVLEPLL